MELRKTFRFEASHILSKHPGKCSRLHGHSWVLHVSVVGPINPETGFVQDFADMSKVVKPIVEALDHRHLGEFFSLHTLVWKPEGPDISYPEYIYPTSERLLWWIAGQLKPLDIYGIADMTLISHWSKVAIEETCTSYAELTREEYDRTNGPTSIYKQKL